PCYNCEPQIPRVLAQFRSIPADLFDEVLVVDNGSRDGTVRAAVEALPHVGTRRAAVVRNDDNYNLGGSHKAAFAYAEREGFTHVVVLHGDDQGNLADLVPVMRDGAHRRYDACLGSRFMRGARLQGYSRFRTFGNAVFNGLFTAAARRRVLDLGSGLNVFARAVYAGGAAQRYPDDLRFNVYLLLGMIDRGQRFMFFPITWREDDQVSNVKIVSQALRTLTIAREYVFQRRRFRDDEHRTVPREGYTFQVVARHEGSAVTGDGARAGSAA
nr:glycosyltransferase family 2 protein [Candidatus Eremiobacteraeota bacterium]